MAEIVVDESVADGYLRECEYMLYTLCVSDHYIGIRKKYSESVVLN